MLKAINFVPGDIVSVHQRITEGEKTRTQVFKGTVIQIRGRGINKMFTVLKKVGLISVERIWPINSPLLEKIVVVEHSKKLIRRAKLNYLKSPKVRP
jgi:large subunit ribosomal protein L19